MTFFKRNDFLHFDGVYDFIEKEKFAGGEFPDCLVEEIRRIYAHHEEDRNTFGAHVPAWINCSDMYKNLAFGLIRAVDEYHSRSDWILEKDSFAEALDMIMRVLPEAGNSPNAQDALKSLIDTFYTVTRETDDLQTIRDTIIDNAKCTRRLISRELTYEATHNPYEHVAECLHIIYGYLGIIINGEWREHRTAKSQGVSTHFLYPLYDPKP